jgi:hypothetical protein
MLMKHHSRLALLLFFATLCCSCKKSGEDPTSRGGATPPPTQPAAEPLAVYPSQEGPGWYIEDTVFDFGEVWAGTVVVHEFYFRSTGTVPVHIVEARPRCACSISDNYTREAPPGTLGVIPFRLDTTTKAGNVDEALMIKTDDPARPELVLRMTGRVRAVCELEILDDDTWKGVAISPDALAIAKKAGGSLGTLKPDQHVRRVLRMRNTSRLPLDLRLLNPPATGPFRVEFREIEPHQEYELTIIGVPPYQSGHNNLDLAFSTGIAEQPKYSVWVNGYLPKRLEVMPEQVIVDPAYPGQETRNIVFRCHGFPVATLHRVETSDPNLLVELVPLRSSGQSLVRVTLPSLDWRPPPYGEVIRLHVGDKEQPIIDVPVVPYFNRAPDPRPADKPLVFYPGRMAGMAGPPPGASPTTQPAH